jgi:hypothetical protein
MGLLEMLSSLGDRLGIVERSSAPGGPTPSKVETRSVTLAELTGEIHKEEVRALAEAPAGKPVTLESIYEAAGIPTPGHGWTMERLIRTLSTDPYKGLDRERIQQRVIDLLAIAKVPSEDLVRDAVSRDQALDAYDLENRKRHSATQGLRQRRLTEIDVAMRELESEAQQLRRQMEADEAARNLWKKTKLQEERALALAVGYLIDRPVVSVDEES